MKTPTHALILAAQDALAYLDQQPNAEQGSVAEVAQCGVRYGLRQALSRYAASDGPHFVIVGYNSNNTPCAAITVYAASAGISAVAANAVLMMHDAGHDYVTRADVIAWPSHKNT